MAGEERETKGWEAQDEKDYSHRAGGRGATTGDADRPGAWDLGRPGSDATDDEDGEAGLLPNGDLASARGGAASPGKHRTRD